MRPQKQANILKFPRSQTWANGSIQFLRRLPMPSFVVPKYRELVSLIAFTTRSSWCACVFAPLWAMGEQRPAHLSSARARAPCVGLSESLLIFVNEPINDQILGTHWRTCTELSHGASSEAPHIWTESITAQGEILGFLKRKVGKTLKALVN